MKHEVFVVSETFELDGYGEVIYINSTWNFKGNKWDARKYADKHDYGAGVQVYNKSKKKYERIV